MSLVSTRPRGRDPGRVTGRMGYTVGGLDRCGRESRHPDPRKTVEEFRLKILHGGCITLELGGRKTTSFFYSKFVAKGFS